MSHRSNISRRQFVQSSSLAAIGTALAVHPSGGADEGLADRPRIGCVGVGGRGTGISRQAAQFGEIVAVCDADLSRARRFQSDSAPQAEVYQHYQQVLDRKDVDVVIQATPDHWHTKINIEACLAGKDVYGEKPLTLTIHEGQQLREVVKRTGRVFQAGTQQRSERPFQTAVELVRNGRLGTLKQVQVALPYYSTKGGPFAEEPIPEELDWDLFLGQAPKHYYTHYRAQNIFRWWYEYAGGIITDWGNHHVDIAHWGMDCERTGPLTVEARGLFPNGGKAECYNTPDRFFARMSYPNEVEVLYFSAMKDRRIYGEVEPNVETSPEELDWLFGADCPEEVRECERNGILFVGDQGRVFVNRGGVYGKPVDELANHPLPADAWRVAPSSNHMGNFFECVRTRQTPVAPVEIEHRTVTACHLTNLSIRLRRKLDWDPDAERFVDDAEANTWLARPQRAPYTTSTS